MKNIAFIFVMALLSSCAGKETKTAVKQDSIPAVKQDTIPAVKPDTAAVETADSILAEVEEDTVPRNPDYEAFLGSLQKVDIDKKTVPERLQKKLLNLFNKKHPKSKLSSYEKQDSMVAMLMTYHDKTSDLMTTAGMIGYSGVDGYLQKLRLSLLNQYVVSKHPEMSDEIQLWSSFNDVMAKYYGKMGELEFFDGSMAPLMSASSVGSLLSCRIDDLKRLSGTGNLKSATSEFRKQIGKNHNFFDPENIGYNNEDEGYIELYKSFVKLESRLKSTFSKWVEARKEVCPEGLARYIKILTNRITPVD